MDHDLNEQYRIAQYNTTPESTVRVYILQPGQVYAGFGGSSKGLLVRKTASLIVQEIFNGIVQDTEYDVNNRKVWERLFKLHGQAAVKGAL